METTSAFDLPLGLDSLAVLEHRSTAKASPRVKFKAGAKTFGCYPKRVKNGHGGSTVRGYCRTLEKSPAAPARKRRTKRRAAARRTKKRPSRSKAAMQRRAMKKQQSLFPWLKIHRRNR